MAKRLIFLQIFLLSSVLPVLAQYPSIHRTRPRIYADSSRFAWLQQHIAVPGDCRTTWNDFLYAYENWWINDPELYLLGSDSTLWTWTWSSHWSKSEAVYTAFIYRLTRDTLALKRCRFLARQVIGSVDTASFAEMEWYTKEDLLRKLSDAGDILLDWVYDDLPPDVRRPLVQSLYAMNSEFMTTFIESGAGNSYVSSHNTWNSIYCNQNALTLYDAEGLNPRQKDTVLQWFQSVFDKHTRGFIPCWTHYRDDDGGWNWGAAYSMWSLVDQFQYFENMRIGTDKNYYADLPWLRSSINQYVYFIQPDNRCIHLGDGLTRLWGDRVMYLHARMFDDPGSRWMAQYWSLPENTPNTNHKFEKLLYRDFDAMAVLRPELPLDWWADKVGLSVSRSSWDDDAAMVTFFNSPSKRAAHEHRDNNSFAIFKNSPLLIDAGHYDSYGSPHYRNYYQRTIAHNSICVYDSLESYSCFGQPASNDGGQIESAALMNYDDILLPVNQRGKWIRHSSGPGYSYEIADAQLSYDSSKLEFFRRRLLYVKPSKVIVLDNVRLRNTASRQRDISWIAHFAEKPAINGSVIDAEAPGHIEALDGDTYSLTHGNGSISIKTLLPERSTVTRIGGSGYEYWVDGMNYPPAGIPDSTFYTPGKWRIEVRPPAPSDSVVFLHAISIGDSVDVAETGGIALKSEVSVGLDWDGTLYFFSSDADTGKYYHMYADVQGGRTVGIFAADLAAGVYEVSVDGQTDVTASADAGGMLQASVSLSSGTHFVEIVPQVTTIEGSSEAESFMVYPNPANDVLHILMRTPGTSYEVRIHDIRGRLVRSVENQNIVNVSGLPSGTYIVQVTQGGKSCSARFVRKLK